MLAGSALGLAGKTRRRIAAEELAELIAVEAKMKKTTAELKAMVLARGSTLMDLHGVGPSWPPGSWPMSAMWHGSPTATGSPPGPAQRHWAHPLASRTGTDFHELGTVG